MALEAAYAAVPRELFLGLAANGAFTLRGRSVRLIPNDPVLVYQDVVVALDRERGVNNGSPSLHARWLDVVVAPKPGEHVAHIGAGTGYYSAILVLNSSATKVASRRLNLMPRSPHAPRKISPIGRMSSVSKAMDSNGHKALSTWCMSILQLLGPPGHGFRTFNVGGRLIFPLGVPRAAAGQGLNAIALLVTRHLGGYSARAWGRVSFVYAESDRANVPEEEICALRDSLQQKDLADIKSLLLDKPQSAGAFWFAGADWALSPRGLHRSSCE